MIKIKTDSVVFALAVGLCGRIGNRVGCDSYLAYSRVIKIRRQAFPIYDIILACKAQEHTKLNCFHVSLWAYGLLRRIGNRVRIPNGTAAVCALCP
jgi:hypothetical protein